MKRSLVFSLVLGCLPGISNAQSNPFLCPADTLQNIQWEAVDGPPAKATAFGQSGDRVFAATDAGLFYSDDTGASWQIQPSTRGMKIERLYAHDSLVLFQYQKTLSIGPYSTPAVQQLIIYRSFDRGNTFQVVYSLDGDGEYFFSLIYPYVSTPFKDLGGGFLYFEHGLPYLGYGAADPYENTRYYTYNYGKNWNSVSLTHVGLSLPPFKITQKLSFCNDTLLGVQAAADTNGNSGFQLNLYPHGQFAGDPVTDTLFTQLPLYHFIYYRGDVYAFVFASSSQLLLQRYSGVLNMDFPASTSADTLLFTAENNTLPSSIWSTDTVLWFRFGNGNIYTSSVQHPKNLSFRYKDIASAFTTFADLPSGQYRCDSRNRTYRSTNKGATWAAAYSGLTTGAWFLTDPCERPVVTPKKVAGPEPPLCYALEPDGSWAYVDSTLEQNMIWTAGKAFGEYYFSNQSKIYKSPECSPEPAWEKSALSSNNCCDVVVQSGNRAYAYPVNCLGCKVWVSDDGDDWQESGFYSAGRLYFSGDTLIFLNKTQLRFSTDQGANWETRFFPDNFDFSWIALEHRRVVGLEDKGTGLQWLVCADFTQSGDTAAWHGRCPLEKPQHAYATFGDAVEEAKLADYSGGVLFLHALEGVYISGDASETWHRLPDLPFKNVYQIPHYQFGTIQTDTVEGGNGYKIIGNYLYAFTDHFGVWRSDWQSILDQLPADGVLSAHQPTEVKNMSIVPNPTSGFTRIELPQGVAGGTFRIFDPVLRLVSGRSFQGNGFDLVVNDLPAGVYFLSVRTENGEVFSGRLVKAGE